MSRRVLIPLALVLVVAGLGVASLAWAGTDTDKLAQGVSIGGIDVGGLTREEALVRLRERVGPQARRPVTLRVGERTFTLSAERAGVRLRLGDAVREAYHVSREGNALTRGWRKLTGGSVDRDLPAAISVDESAVRTFVGNVHARLARKPVDASIAMSVESVKISPAKNGRRLAGRDDLVKRIVRGLSSSSGDRSFRGRMITLKPKITEDGLWDTQPVAVTVSRSGTTVRLFRRGKLEKTYQVAVGQPKYPTPTGRFVVQTKQVNPIWNVPQAEWAGDLAGKSIPSGDPRNPLKARWIGFSGSVGFHGTDSIGSIGTAASHGCVRMRIGDIVDLYDRVEVGTPILVA